MFTPLGSTRTATGNYFTTTTQHARQRTYKTRLEADAAGYDFRYHGLVESLSNYEKDMNNIIQNKKMVNLGLDLNILSSKKKKDNAG